MKINTLNSVNFRGKIIDTHVHIGEWYGKNYTAETLDKFVKSPLTVQVGKEQSTDTISKMLVSSMNSMGKDCKYNETDGLKEILEETKKNSKLKAVAVCQPSITKGDTTALDNAIKQNREKIFGLKFHPSAFEHPVSAQDSSYVNYMKLAQKYKLPCIFHTDSDDFSSAKQVYELAKTTPDVPVILGHSGGYFGFDEAKGLLEESVVKKDAKLYFDISWLNWDNGLPDGKHTRVKELIDVCKKHNATDRILFGTDVPLGCFGENPVEPFSEKQAYEKTVSGIKTMIKNSFGSEADELTEKIFYKNADALFFQPKRNALLKKAGAIGLATLAIAGIGGIILHNKAKNKTNN